MSQSVALGAAVVMLLAALGFAWLTFGPVGQRGREIRASRGGRPGRNTWISLAAAALLFVLVAVLGHH